MTAAEVLQDLRDAGVTVALEGEALRLRGPDAALTPDRLRAVREQKAALVELLHADFPESVQWERLGIAALLDATRAAGADVALSDGAAVVLHEERLPSGLRAEVERRRRGFLLCLTHSTGGDEALTDLLRAEERSLIEGDTTADLFAA